VVVIVAILLDSSVFVSAFQTHHLESYHSALVTSEGSPLLSPIGSTPNWDFKVIPGESANQTNRVIILSFITANPGAYLRELTEDLDLSMGVVQYHVWALTKAGDVEDCRMGRFRRFFRVGVYKEMERKVISLLKQETAGRILALLSNGRPLSHMKLANLLGISSQGLSWQMARLRRGGFVEAQRTTRSFGVEYALTCESLQIVRGLTRNGHDLAASISSDQRTRCEWATPSVRTAKTPRINETPHRFWY
jgi:DNA-binding transcriptional ArsR family regulator